jgi:predicted metal-dependent hydrolase
LDLESSIQVTLPDKSIAIIKVIKSRRSKRMRIRVDRNGISIISPITQDIQKIINFISDRNTWILNKTKLYTKLNSKLEFGPLQKDEIIYLGKKYKIQFIKDALQYTVISESLMKITFHVKDRRRYKRNIANWYRERTKHILNNKLPFCGKKLSISYGKVRIRNQKLRWGSCSKDGNLNFNLLLSALPINIIDYIIVHELFHMIEFNHSDCFWELVGKAHPSYKSCRTWLKNNGAYLQID